MHPAKTADLYFVADGTGGHTFSETLKEHNSAVQKWRGVEKQAKVKQGASDTSTDPTDATPIPAGTSDIPAKASSKRQSRRRRQKRTASQLGAAAGDDGSTTSGQSAPAAAVSPASASDIPLPVRKPSNQ